MTPATSTAGTSHRVVRSESRRQLGSSGRRPALMARRGGRLGLACVMGLTRSTMLPPTRLPGSPRKSIDRRALHVCSARVRSERRSRHDTGSGHRLEFITRLGRTEPHLRGVGYAIAIGGRRSSRWRCCRSATTSRRSARGSGYLCVVVAAAAIGGLGPGVLASFLGFVTFNYFFLPPYGTFTIGRPEFAVVLFVFLGLSVVISELLARATERAHSAELREAELTTIQALSRELTLRVPGPETYQAALSRLCEVFGFSAATLFIESSGDARGPDRARDRRRDRPAAGGLAGIRGATNSPRSGFRCRWGPAPRDDRAQGGPSSRCLPSESRVLRAFCDQVALVLERDRLLKTATEAEIYRQTEASRRALLAAVSHDLRSPLAAIKASATDLLDEEGGAREEDRREALLAIDAETDRLNDLIANLLDISRIEGGMLRAKMETVDLTEIVTECADRAGRQQPQLVIETRIAQGRRVGEGRRGLLGPHRDEPAGQRRQGRDRGR